MNQHFEKIFVITSFDTFDRVDDLSKVLKSNYINYELVVAPKSKYFVEDYKKTQNNRYNQSLISANESIFKKCQIQKIDSFCIMEDDVVFGNDYKNMIDEFMHHVPSDWDVLNLGYHFHSSPLTGDIFCKYDKQIHNLIGTHVNCYKKSTVDVVLESFDKAVYPIDLCLNKQNVYNNFNTYIPVKKIFFAGSYRDTELDKNEYYKKYKSIIGD